MGTANDYQEWTKTTAIYRDTVKLEVQCPECEHHFFDERTTRLLRKVYVLLGLGGELGEIFEKVKKHIRGGKDPDELFRDPALGKEFGDLQYYLPRAEDEFGFRAEEVMNENREKLESRKARGVLHGDGDNR